VVFSEDSEGIDREFYKDSKGFRWETLDGSYGLGHPLNSIKILQEFYKESIGSSKGILRGSTRNSMKIYEDSARIL